MDVDRMLNMEKRTGVKSDDIDDFVRKATELEQAIKGLAQGTVKPEDIKIDGIETEEDKEQKRLIREEKLRIQRVKDEELRLKRKQEEKERWWAGAELYKPKQDEEARLNAAGIVIEDSLEEKDKVIRERNISRYTADYSKWDSWQPSDEVTRLEQLEQERLEEEKKNKEFEANNADFCKQFVTDMETRKKATKQKQESAEILRLKGNRYFKAKDFTQALTLYMDALKNCPFDGKLLLNIAQAQIKLKAHEDALEFINRTLYLDSQNVKALSRKAFVLAEDGKSQDALDAINTALALEPANTELIAQQREISVIVQEKEAEHTLAKLSIAASATSSSVAKPAPQSPSSGKRVPIPESDENTGMRAIDAFKALLQQTQQGAESQVQQQAHDLIKTLQDTPILKSYFKSQDVIVSVLAAMKMSSTQKEDVEVARKTLTALLKLITIAMDGQRSIKQTFVEQKGYSFLKTLLENLSVDQLAVVDLATAAIHTLCKDDVCLKSRAAVFVDKVIVAQLSGVVGNLTHNLQQPHSNSNNNSNATVWTEAQISHAHNAIRSALYILKEMIFSGDTNGKLLLTTQDKACATTLVCALGCALHFHHQLYHSKAQHNNASVKSLELHGYLIVDAIELLIEVMLGLSQLENMRACFAFALPLPSTSPASSPTAHTQPQTDRSTIYSIIQVIKTLPIFSLNAIAILMNASLEADQSSGSVKQVIYRDGGLDIAISDLHLSEVQRRLRDENNQDGILFTRKAGLLSRLVIIPEVQQTLMQHEHYRMIVHRIGLSSAGGIMLSKWMIDEQLHYIRILAALPSPSNDHKEIALQEHVFTSLLALFPKPREECGEITPSSVTLVPLNAGTMSAQLIGNAARCLMPYADDATYGRLLYKDKDLITIEKWICAMATCTDMRVRKNIAILLAKACKIPGNREKITHFRGLQMMIELQDKL